METHFNIAKIAAMVITALGMLCFVLIGRYVIKSHKGDKNYKRRKTVSIFNWLFALLAISEILTVLYILFYINPYVTSFFLMLKAILIIATVTTYYLSIPKFVEKNISIIDHKNTVENLKTIAKIQIEQLNISKETKKQIAANIDIQ
ncbi:hypothetical protein [Cochleicola gelatinilyticus]|uniref:Uncharacterized protein n=1 Tax=Cochleicola gelatinilyticus TaxID=1763537 RepID=A0A167IKR8_9FLAO|nr:hypothetical protein [Cochleicola gelatinilyticus]OAB79751.1 hypothetical protein ULVI_03120 [Cochleicola gelatinilyticus]